MRPFRVVLATLAFIVLAGCSQPAPDPTVTPTQTSSTEPAPPATEITLGPLVELGVAPGEPNVAVAPDGTIYVVSITTMWKSEDGGRTFDPVTDNLHGGGDGDLAVDGDGGLHYLGLGGQDGPIPYQRSTDGGETFSDAIDISDEGGNDREWIHATPDGRLYAVWRDVDGLVVNVSPDGGVTWNGKTTVTGDAVAGQITTHPVDSSKVYFPYLTFGGVVAALGGEIRDAGLHLAHSEDGGETWTLEDIGSARGSFGDIFAASVFPVAAVDANGTIYVVASLKSEQLAAAPKGASQYAVYLFVSKDGGASWSEPERLNAEMTVAVMPWVAAGAPGRIAVSWYQNAHGLPHEQAPDQWDIYLAESLDADAAARSYKVQKMTDAPAHVGGICTSGTACGPGDRSLLDFFELAIQPNGQPVVAWAGDQQAASTTVQNPVVYVRTVASGPSLL